MGARDRVSEVQAVRRAGGARSTPPLPWMSGRASPLHVVRSRSDHLSEYAGLRHVLPVDAPHAVELGDSVAELDPAGECLRAAREPFEKSLAPLTAICRR